MAHDDERPKGMARCSVVVDSYRFAIYPMGHISATFSSAKVLIGVMYKLYQSACLGL